MICLLVQISSPCLPVSSHYLSSSRKALECLQYSSHHGSHPLHLSVSLLHPLPPPRCQPLLSPYLSPLSPEHQPHHSPAYPHHHPTHSCHTTANWSSSPPYPHHIPPHTPQGPPHTTLQEPHHPPAYREGRPLLARAHAAAHHLMAVYSLMPGSMYAARMAPLLKVAPSSLMQPPPPSHSALPQPTHHLPLPTIPSPALPLH